MSTNALATFRANLVHALDQAQIPTTDHLPSVIGTTPAAILQHGAPYLELTDAQTYAEAEFRARLDVRLLADPTTDNADATHALDHLLVQAATALTRAGFDPLDFQEPEIFVSQGINYLSIRITVSEWFTIERTEQ